MSLRATATSSSFSSIQAFQTYFQAHDELFLPANQPLEIKNISSLTRYEGDPLDVKEIFPKDLAQLTCYLLDKMLLPLAKTVKIRLSGQGELDVRINEHLYFSCEKEFTLNTEKGPICARLTDFFRLMIASSISKVEFAPHQEFYLLGITEEESKLEAPWDASINTINQIFIWRAPQGYRPSLCFEGQTTKENCCISSGAVEVGGSTPQKRVMIQSIHPWSLNLVKSTKSLFTIDGFCKWMKIQGELKIPAHQTLRIEGEIFQRLEKEYSQAEFTFSNFGRFALNQIVLPLGKTIKIVIGGENNYIWQWNTHFLELSSAHEITLITESGNLYTTLTNLGHSLISNRISSLVLQPHQKLIFYGLTEVQYQQLGTWVKAQDWETTQVGLGGFLAPYHPVGFTWALTWSHHFYKASMTWENYPHAYGLLMESRNGLTLSLERASGEWLVLNLINNSSPELLQGLLDADEKAFIYILFKAMFYFCCDDFRYFRTDELPEFFTEATQLKLIDLLKNDANFTEALRLILKNPELELQLSKILDSSPETFSQLSLEKLSIPLKTLMSTLMKLVYGELQGSPFISKCVRFIGQGLTEGRFRNLLRQSLSEKATAENS